MKIKSACIFFLFIAFAIPFAIFLLPMLKFGEALQKVDWYSPFYIFTLQLGIAALLFVKLFKDFTRWLKSIAPSYQIITSASIITLVAILICIFCIEGRSRVQEDESVYLTTAQNLYYNKIGINCIQGVFTDGNFECIAANTIKPRGLSYLYMLGMPIFGTDLRWVYNFQTFILFLTLPIFFLAILAWTKNQLLSLLTITLLANCPALLLYSKSASIEAFYVLMFAISLLLLKWAYDRNTTRHWILLALALAFFAQTRSETVFCLFAFIGVVFYRICLNRDLLDSMINRISKVKFALFSILNSQFSIFLATLSAFSIPVLCTISLNRESDLQGGSYGARWHLLENIAINFKIMAFSSYDSEGIFLFPYFPYFTWFALFGLITLILCLNQDFQNSRIFKIFKFKFAPLSIKYSHIALFLLLLSPQYLILFDSVSADLSLAVQQRFVLVILPAMSFLGALFIWQTFMQLKNLVNPLILIILVQTVILVNTISHHDSFKLNIINWNNASLLEHYQLQKLTLKLEKPSMFFALLTMQFLEKGLSVFGYNLLADVEENVLNDLLKTYNGNVFAVENSQCKHSHSVPKMTSSRETRSCDRIISYFDVDTILNVNLIRNTNRNLLVYKILGLNERDKKGLLRIFDKVEPTQDSVQLVFKIPQDTIVPWKVQHFLNNEFLHDSPYTKGFFTDNLEFSQFTKDTNVWRLDIVDTITNERIHSDFWELVKVRK
jgi:hypothetical protein